VHAEVRVEARRTATGRTAFPVLRSQPPLTARLAGDAVWLVGTAAGPLGGDRVEVDLGVGGGVELTVRSAAATVALAGDAGEGSALVVRAVVGSDARLLWLPEPLVATGRCNHRSTARISMEPGAVLVWREELVAGRTGEAPGSCAVAMQVDTADGPVLRHELRIGPGAPGWAGPAVLDGARATGTVVVVGVPDLPVTTVVLPLGAVVQPLPAGGVLVTALAPGAAAVRQALDEAVDRLVTRRSRSGFGDTGGAPATMV
jgi:urease accessory protein